MYPPADAGIVPTQAYYPPTAEDERRRRKEVQQPMKYFCPQCQQEMMSRVVKSPSTLGLALNAVGAVLLVPLAFVGIIVLPKGYPFERRADHYCPTCNSLFASHKC